MKLNIPGLLGALGELPSVINKGLLGPLTVNPNLGLDPAQVDQARQVALQDMAYGMMAAPRSNPTMGLALARGNARGNFDGRVFDMLKEQELIRLRADRTKKEQEDAALMEQQAALEESMRNAPPPPGLNIPLEAWAALPAKDKVTLYGQYTPPKPVGPQTVSPGSSLVDPATGRVIYTNPALPRSDSIQLLMPGQLPDNVPATIRQAIAGNEAIIRKVDETIAAHEAYKAKKGGSATGMLKSGSVVAADTLLPGSPGVGLVDLADPEGVAVRSGVADIGSAVFHDRSGAAVTLSESPRLRPFVPEGNKDMDTSNVPNLKRLREEAIKENEIILKSYGVPYQYGAQTGGQQNVQPHPGIEPAGMGKPDETKEMGGVKYVRYGTEWFKETR